MKSSLNQEVNKFIAELNEEGQCHTLITKTDSGINAEVMTDNGDDDGEPTGHYQFNEITNGKWGATQIVNHNELVDLLEKNESFL